jgi:aspartyl protease family protein
VIEIPKDFRGGVMELGEPLLFKAASWLTFGSIPDGSTVNMHPMAFAAWFGMNDIAAMKASFADQAVIEVEGKRRTLRLGQYASSASRDTRQKVTLAADLAGHFYADGQVNGGSVRFLVDTGATMIALPASTADRLGIDYQKGRRGLIQTANGPTVAYRIKLDQVRLGGITLQNVDAVVIARGLGIALLGMSFLNRVEMQRDGQSMILTRRY